MNNKGVGAIFCLISALLFAARYLAAAIFMSGTQSWDAVLFSHALSYGGAPLLIASINAAHPLFLCKAKLDLHILILV